MLNKTQLEADLLAIYTEMKDNVNANNPMSDAVFAQKMANAIHDYTLSATVFINTFSAENSAGPIVGTATGELL